MTRKQKKVLIRILVSAALLIALHFIPAEGFPRFLLYLIPYGIIGYDILLKAGKGILHRQVLDENLLMAIATLGALVLGLTRTGDYAEAVAVMLFYQIGELFQSVALGKSRRSISALMDIRPDYANVEENGRLVRKDPEEIVPGTLITVQPGERVPLDGVVTEGHSSLDTGALTGESVPRDVAPGEEIISGCINLSGVLTVRTTREFGESTVSRVLDLVENASSRKSRSEHFAGGGHRRRTALPGSAPFPPGRRAFPGLGRMGIPGADLPGHQLSLRAGDQHSPELLCRHRRRQPGRNPGQGFQLSGGPVQNGHRGL